MLMCIAALFTTAKSEYPQVNIQRNKMWYTNTMEYYVAFEKKAVLPFMFTWVILEDIMLSEINEETNTA